MGFLLLSGLFVTGSSFINERAQSIPGSEQAYAEGRALVKFSRGVGPSAARDVIEGLGLETIKTYQALSRIQGYQYALVGSKDKSTEKIIKKLKKKQTVVSVSPDYKVHALDQFPNDTDFGDLWGLHNTGQEGGTADIDIDAPEAWDFTTGSDTVVIGVIDSGIDYNHPDLQANIWANPGETPDNGIDDDGNGYVDDIHGINAITGTGDPVDTNEHGTHVAGIIGAAGNNAQGVTGVNWTVKMIAGKFLNADGSGWDSDALECINYFIDLKNNHGVNIVALNASYGGAGYSDTMRDAINAAGTAGILFCAAAGNDGDDTDSSPHYPASYDCSNIISVTGVDRDGALLYNYGAATVDLGAPGTAVLSTVKGEYVPGSGDLFFDDMELGGGSWTTGGPHNDWAITTDQEGFEDASFPVPSPPNFWSDSPGADYDRNCRSYLMTASDLDLSAYAGQPVHLGFGAALYIENYYDHAYVEVSGDSGSTWTQLTDFSGYGYLWSDYDFALPESVKTSQFRMRFRMDTDNSVQLWGWLLDDIGVGTNVSYDYNSWGGTSTAAPYVTGAVALCAAYFPSESAADRKDRILNSVMPLSSLSGNCVSEGMLNLYNALTYSPVISGTVTAGGSGLENVYMNGLPHDTFTNGSGEYEDYVVSGWGGTVTPALTGYAFTPSDRTYSGITADQTGQDYSAAVLTYEITGTVTAGGSGLENVVMSGLPGDPVTNSLGEYSGTVDHGWSGTVTPTLDCYTFTPPSADYTNVTSDQTGEDYTAVLDTYTISGTVTEGASGLENVVMSGLPGGPVTNSLGEYSGIVDCGWSGTVTPTLAGYTFTPASADYTDVHSDQTQDYTATLNTYTIAGAVTSGGSGLSGVTITGLPASPVTIADGTYSDTVDHGWSGTAAPALTGYTFTPANIPYSNVTSDQTGQDYTAALIGLTISGTVTADSSGLAGVTMSGLPASPATTGGGTYSDTVDYGWSGTVIPVLAGYTFTPESIDYSDITADQTSQDYIAEAVYPNAASNYQVIPEVLWAPATGGGTWMTEVQLTDVTGGSEVSVYFNSAAGDRRGPFVLWSSTTKDFSKKFTNVLNTLDGLDSGFSYYAQAGSLEFFTQDADHKIQVTARTSNGNYSKTFQGLNHNDDNTAAASRTMMIQNLVSNENFRTAYGGFNPTSDSITVEFELIDNSGNTIGSSFTRSFSGRQYSGFSPFTEAGVPYPDYTFDNAWMKITHVSGSGELMSYGATANNTTNDPAVHMAVQAADIGGFNSPSDYQVIPEVLWAPATGGGTWMTEVQITDITGGSEVSVYFNSVTGDRRGPIALFTGSGPGVSAKAGNLLNILSQLDPGFDYTGQAGAVEFVTQDTDHKIQVIARTKNGNYSKTFQGINPHDANTLTSGRTLMVQNTVSDDSFRTAFGAFNPSDTPVTVLITIVDEYGNTIGNPIAKTFPGRNYQGFSPFSEAGAPYPSYNYDNTWIKIEVTSGGGQLIVYGATANSTTNDPAVHRAIQY
jgi:subtilisin family serine protease